MLPASDDEAAILRQWHPKGGKVPPGHYRVSSQEYDQPVRGRTMHIEVLWLVPLDGPTPPEPLWLVARHTVGAGSVEDDRLEGDPVLERRSVRVLAAGPGQLAAPAGSTALVERTSERLYVSRPSFLADGAPAPFGRDLAVLAWTAPETGKTPGPLGQAAWEDIAARWSLADMPAQTASDRDSVAAETAESEWTSSGDGAAEADWDQPIPTPPAHADHLDVTLAQATTISELPVDVLPAEAVGPPAVEGEMGQKRAALAHMHAGRFDEAAKIFEALDAQGRLDGSSLANLAAIRIEKGDMAAAEEAATRALALNPERESALLNLGLSFELRGRRSEAQDTFRRALALHPQSAALKAALVRVGAKEPK